MGWRQRLARRLDPGHYRVAARKAQITDKVFQLQAWMIEDPDAMHPEARSIVKYLTQVEPGAED